MGDKVYTLVISVDLGCCRCRQAIQDYLCQLQRKHCNRIVAIVFEEKNNVVLVSGPFDPEQLKRQLLCKFPKIINRIDIREPPKPKPPPEPKPPPDEHKEKWLRECLEEKEEIHKCIEKCKKECEEKCRTECEKKIKCKCKRECECECECKGKCKGKCECKCECKRECERKCECKRECECKCKCKRKCECKCKCEKEDPPNEPPMPPVCPEPPKPPVCPWPPLVVCCPRPCPCFTPWSNSFRCCSCGVECWPGMCVPGWGSGPSHIGGRPQWRNCESSQPPNIVFESAAPSCSLM